MANSKTSEHRARRLAVVIASSCCALLAASCSVYDASLLDRGELTSGGGDSGGAVVGGGSSSVGGTQSSSGGDVSGAGSDDEAGAGSSIAGAGAVGHGGSPTGGAATTGGGSGGAPSSGGGSSGAAEMGGAMVGGATSLSLIDDMENTDPYILDNDNRQGFWSLAGDGTVGGKLMPSPMVMTLIPNGRDGSLHGLHVTATGFTSSGAQVTVDLNRKGATRATYDASAYVGVHFWAKVETGTFFDTRFAILDRHTDPEGALCCMTKDTCGSGNISNGLCYDNFYKSKTFTKDWAEYTVMFTQLTQDGWGMNNLKSLDVANVYTIQISWLSASMDLWIDDIAFIKK